ncbi:MAG: DUF1080 domain-containing protein [Candidatus Omnitrophica bacterium]|nr:DUF1080 domain-containing protein [Candidatus Omnitrophota bacterium]
MMRKIWPIALLAVFGVQTGLAEKPKPTLENRGWTSLFNGEDLSGWRVIGDGKVTVEDGAMVIEDGPSKEYSWVISEKSYDNFVFHVRFKRERGNSGIQFRSQQDGGMVVGYQADIDFDSDWITGHLYEQDGRGSLAKAPEGLVEMLPTEEWIDYEIVAAGDRIQLFMNGIPTVDIEDPEGAKSGHFAFQIHSGAGCKVRWKDIRILPLEKWESSQALFDGSDLEAGWYPVGDEKWTVQDDAIRGQTQTGKYGWLVGDREYSDFILTFRYRWKSGNSGVQFRSWLVGGEEMHGYQADIDPSIPRMTGSLYDEHERGTLEKGGEFIDPDYELGRWHHYEISAIGDDIRLYHDGALSVHFKETVAERIRKGIIALQVHSAPLDSPVDIEWKDIQLINLEPPSPWE